MIISNRTADLLLTHQESEEIKKKEQDAENKENLKDHPLDFLSDNPNVRDTIHDMASEAFMPIAGGYEFYDVDTRITDSRSGSGFHDYTNGVFEVVGYTSVGDLWSSGRQPDNKRIRKVFDELEKEAFSDARESFIQTYAKELRDAKIDINNIDYHSLYNAGHSKLAERLSEEESDALGRYNLVFYIKIFYFSPDSRHKPFQMRKPQLTVRGGVRESIEEKVFDKSFAFSSLKELREKLGDCLKVIQNRLA